MFGFGFLTYIKIGLAVVVLAVCGYFVYEYKHMATVIAKQQVEINNLHVEQDVQAKKQLAFDEALAEQAKIKTRVVYEKQSQQRIVALPGPADNADLRALYDHYRMLPDGTLHPATDGRGGRLKGSPRNKTATP